MFLLCTWRLRLLAVYLFSCTAALVSPHRSRNSHSRVPFRPFPAGHLSDYEVRGGGSHDVSDYVLHGLSSIQHMVEEQYGLRNSESFYWGRDGNPLANLTAYVDDKNVRVLSMERFSDVLDAARCSNDSIEFKFSFEAQFDKVKRAWNWVNDADDNYIILITENAQCNVPDGDPTARQPWHITRAVFNDHSNTVVLSAESRTWQEAFSSWHLKISSRGITPHRPAAHHGSSKRYEIVGDPQIPLAMDFSGASLPMTLGDEETAEAEASISCDPCYTTGSLDFDIDVIPYTIPPRLSGHFQVIADDVSAVFTAKASASAPLYDGATGHVTLWGQAIPDLGIYIKDVIELGPVIKVNIEGELGKVEAEVNVSAGVTVTIPDDAIYKIDFDDESQNESSDWTPQLSYIPPTMSSSISMSANVATELRLEFDGEIVGIGVSVGAQLAAPSLDLEAKAFMEADACDVSGAQYGFEVDVELGAALDTFEDATLVGIQAGATQTIAAISYPLFSTCWTLASAPPGISSNAASGSAISSSPASSSSWPASGSSHPASESSVPAATSSAIPYSSSIPAASSHWASSSSYVAPASSSIPATSSYWASSSSNAALASSYAMSSSSVAVWSSAYASASGAA